MEATCLELVPGLWVRDREGLAGVSATGRVRVSRVCGAPIPRLDGNGGEPCNERPWRETDPDAFCARGLNHYLHAECEPDCGKPHHHYLGPLASECTRGHPVAVPSETERRG
jgi:hypothetical protein